MEMFHLRLPKACLPLESVLQPPKSRRPSSTKPSTHGGVPRAPEGEYGRWWEGGDRPTEPYIDSQIDSHKYYKNKKANRIIGLDVVTGGDAGIRTLDPGFAQMRP